MTLSIAIAGAAGRMGRALIRAASGDPRFTVVGGTERREGQFLGTDLGALAGIAPLFMTTSDAADHAADKADVWIDFTTPEATVAALEALTHTTARAAIVGTTGLSAEQEHRVAAHAQRIAIVRSGNFSLGVNLLAALVEQAAQKLGPEWDIEIAEAHHRRKVDAPSGTALLLGEAAAHGRGKRLSDLKLAPYDGAAGPRPEGPIGFSVIRGGGIVGAHDARFIAEREMLTLSHQAFDRAVFADGALAAALWAADKPPGLYSMRDVLGL
ncbi:MAG TPA: 4-hydroxy-tetrahydrodipicolinate reductase [Vitreimonas sp.]|uniref:4-hydroxy-tetrahydrodipicolinate reductase n=1 Tax=Vitreimonas sp. TaxID=3069702 RepID=UPI002D471003|nr:4-hydroxy-tetrahydrodipicolinate reductase [Vitreimonas sp.]HYD89595.1 4-hydroxy-tetrahydrodipicolinate reductase [Vitreimonas sp.]